MVAPSVFSILQAKADPAAEKELTLRSLPWHTAHTPEHQSSSVLAPACHLSDRAYDTARNPNYLQADAVLLLKDGPSTRMEASIVHPPTANLDAAPQGATQ